MKTESYRQGDIYLRKINKLPDLEKRHYFSTEDNANIDDKQSKEIILAYSEATGHKHAIYDGNAILVKEKNGNKFFLIVNKNTILKHEEHNEIILPIGNYEVIRQREYFPNEIRRVVD